MQHEEGQQPVDKPQSVAPKRSRRVLIIAGIAVVVVLGIAAAFFLIHPGSNSTSNASAASSSQTASNQSQSTATTSPAAGSTTATPTGPPAGSVRLPQGGTARLVRSDVAHDGSLPIPEHLDEATVWGADLGASQGATLMAGHVNWQGKIGPFNELWQDKVGDKVTVVDQQGRTWIFQVSNIATVPKDQLAQQAQQLYGPSGPYRLVLATCGGEYVGGTEGYKDNRFVTATLISRP